MKNFFKRVFRRTFPTSLKRAKKTQPKLKNFELCRLGFGLKLRLNCLPEKKWPKRAMKFALLLVLGITTGTILGGWYLDKINGAKIDYSSYKESDFAYSDDEITKIFELVTGLESPSEQARANFVTLAQQQGLNPQNLTPSQNVFLAYYKASLANTYRAIGNGNVSNSFSPQTAYSRWLYDGQNYSYENISIGTFKQVGTRVTMGAGSNTVTVIDGKNLRQDDADWTGARSQYTKADYKNMTGASPDVLNHYILSDKTILNEKDCKIEVLDDGNYSFTIDLHLIGAMLNYAKQIQTTSGLSQAPKFNSAKMTIVLDKDWTLISRETVESYTIVYGIPVECSSVIKVDYQFNVDIDEEVLV